MYSRDKLHRLVQALVLGLCFVLHWPLSFFGNISSGLDPSWQVALHLIHRQGLSFGREVIFTYGPLGFLSTRLPFDGVKPWLLASDLILFGSILILYLEIFRRIRSWPGILLVAAISLSFSELSYFIDLSFCQLYLAAFFLLLHAIGGGAYLLFLACLLAVLGFFVKMNTGLIGVGLLLLGCALLALHNPKRWRLYFMAVCSLLLLTLAGSAALNVELLPYIRTSLMLVDGYNDAMGFDASGLNLGKFELGGAVFSGLLLLLVLVNLRYLWADTRRMLVVITLGALSFILFKQSFVRADAHVYIFYNYIAAVLGMGVLCLRARVQRMLLVVCLVALSAVLGLKRDSLSYRRIPERFAGARHYFEELLDRSPAAGRAHIHNQVNFLSSKLQAHIGHEPVDILPWEIAYAFYHNLNYAPRPIFQSYAAYTPALDQLNAEYFLSARAPAFALVGAYCIDGRYCFFEEAKTKLALLRNYKLIDRSRQDLLLKRRPAPLTVTTRELVAGEIGFGEKLILPRSENLLMLEMQPRYSWLGRLARFFYQPSELRMKFELANGLKRNYRVIKPMLEGGVFVGGLMETLHDMANFFKRDTEDFRSFTSVMLEAKRPWEFGTKLQYKIYEVVVGE